MLWTLLLSELLSTWTHLQVTWVSDINRTWNSVVSRKLQDQVLIYGEPFTSVTLYAIKPNSNANKIENLKSKIRKLVNETTKYQNKCFILDTECKALSNWSCSKEANDVCIHGFFSDIRRILRSQNTVDQWFSNSGRWTICGPRQVARWSTKWTKKSVKFSTITLFCTLD